MKRGDLVKITSKCGSTILIATISNEVKEGTLFAYSHNPYINYVVCDDLDEDSKTPRYNTQ